jgi:hypothetical protein
LQTGAYTDNAFTNAMLGDNANTASQIRNALYGGQQASQNAAASNNAAQQGINNAENTSAANVGEQKTALTGALAAANSTATANQALTNSATAALDTGSPAALQSALASPQLMSALGLNPAQVQSLLSQEQAGQLTQSQVSAQLTSYLSSASNTGLDATGATNINQIQGLLSGTAPTGSATAATNSSATPINTAATVAANQKTLSQLSQAVGNARNMGGFSNGYDSPDGAMVTAGLSGLLSQGYSLQQIEQQTGITPYNIQQLVGMDPSKPMNDDQLAAQIHSLAGRKNTNMSTVNSNYSTGA